MLHAGFTCWEVIEVVCLRRSAARNLPQRTDYRPVKNTPSQLESGVLVGVLNPVHILWTNMMPVILCEALRLKAAFTLPSSAGSYNRTRSPGVESNPLYFTRRTRHRGNHLSRGVGSHRVPAGAIYELLATETSVYARRAFGGDRDHRRLGSVIIASGTSGPRVGPPDAMFE